MSARTHQLLTGSDSITCNPREWQPTGGVEVKGKGNMETFLWREFALPRRGSSTRLQSPHGSLLPDDAMPPMRSISPSVSSDNSALHSSGAAQRFSDPLRTSHHGSLQVGNISMPADGGASLGAGRRSVGGVTGTFASGLMALRSASFNTTASGQSSASSIVPPEHGVNGQLNHPVSLHSSAPWHAAPTSRGSSYLLATGQSLEESSSHSLRTIDMTNTVSASAPLPLMPWQRQDGASSTHCRMSLEMCRPFPPVRASGSRRVSHHASGPNVPPTRTKHAPIKWV